jgi:DNA segregation ATPase FtsK/SpoIIIE-like protein
MVRMANRARAAGIIFILSATNPKAEVMNTSLRNACTSRIAFRCNEASQSRTILDRSGAEHIPPATKGRFLARLPDQASLQELQAFYVPDEMLLAVARQVAGGAIFHSALSAEIANLVRWAIAENNGYLSLADIQAQAGLGQKEARRLAEEWERRGWLEKDKQAGNKRRVTDELERVLGLDADNPTDPTNPASLTNP